MNILTLNFLLPNTTIAEYLTTSDNGNCCVIDPASDYDTVDNFHRNCVCENIESVYECEEMCSKDINCKGFTHRINDEPTWCQLATTSKCPYGCRGPYQPENTAPLDEKSEHCWHGNYAGCYIKQIGNTIFSSYGCSKRRF